MKVAGVSPFNHSSLHFSKTKRTISAFYPNRKKGLIQYYNTILIKYSIALVFY